MAFTTNESAISNFTIPFTQGLIASHILFFAIGVTGNSIVCWNVLRTLKNFKIHDFLILNLALSDLLYAIVSFSIFIPVLQQFLEGNGLRFDANNIICRIYSALPLYFGYANLNSMTLLAGVRYIIIVKPQQSSRLNDKSSIAIICIINWILPIAFIIPQIFGVWGRFLFLADIGLCVTYASYTQGTSQISHFIIVSIFQFFLPISICCWCYMEIFLEVRGSRKRVFGMTASPSRNENTSEGLKKSTSLTLNNNKKTELAVAKTLSVILLIYLISYVPYSIITVIVFCNPKPTPALLKVQAVMIQVTYIANVSNPIVFLFRSPKTRAKIQEWFALIRGHCHQSKTKITNISSPNSSIIE